MPEVPVIGLLDELIAEATDKLAALMESREKIEREMEVQQRVLEMLRSRRAERSRKQRVGAVQRAAGQDASRVSLADQVAALLERKGSPMRATDIAAALDKEGVTTSSHRGLLPMVLSSLIRRRDRFRKVSRGKYALKKGGEKSAATQQDTEEAQ